MIFWVRKGQGQHLSVMRDLLVTTVLSGFLLAAQSAGAQSPQGGVVASGSASIAQTAQQSVINQTTERAVIDWQGFDVGRDHTVTFNQPGRSSATLNRVNSASASVIRGAINAPGTVVIQNTAGVLFTGDAQIDTGGLVASSQLVDPGHFMNSGNFRIGGGERPGARVVNEGTFSIGDAGLAALVGSNVGNAGTIVAHLGTVALASGETTTIDLAGDGVFQIAVSGTPEAGRATNAGRIDVSGGRVLISAGGAAGVLDTVINTSGIIRAASGTDAGGRVELIGRGGGQVNVSGAIEATGQSTGGSVRITGETVNLARSAEVDASGAVSGGEVLIGGGFQGTGDLRRATKTVLNMGSVVTADGTSGRGGTVVIWSDESTWFDGSISTVGAISGGLVETSGKINLGTGDNASVTAGNGGTWLLDPRNVRIAASGTNVSAGTTNPPSGAGEFQIRGPSIVAALNGNSDVVITTDQPASSDAGNITVATALRWNGSGNLTLDADGSIVVNRNIQTRGAGDLTLTAGDTVDVNQSVQTSGTGDIFVNAGADIRFDRPVFSTGAGNVTATADASVLVNRATQISGSGDLTLVAGDTIVVDRRLRTTNAGDLILRAQNSVTINNNVIATQGGDVSIRSANGDVRMGGSNGHQRISTNSGDVTVEATTGSIVLQRTNTRQRNTQIYASAGDIALTAGTEIKLQGGEANRQFVRIGRSGDMSDISLTAPKVSVIAGDTVSQGTAQIIAGSGGSISIDADEIDIETGDANALASIQALNGATLTLDAATQTWDGLVRASGSGASGGDVTLIGDITASVRPVFDLVDGADFSLNVGNATGSFQATGVPLEVTTTGGSIGVDGTVQAPQVTLESDTGVTLGSGAQITGTAAGDAVVIAAGNRFENNAGAAALQAPDPSGRWLLYMNQFASLAGTAPASGSFDLYNRPFASNPPSSLSGFAGNRIVYGEQPGLTVTAVSRTKTYGDDVTGTLTYNLTGLRAGDSEASALAGPVSISSTGSAANAAVAGSPYTIAVTAAASSQGYNVTAANGTLTIDPASLTITANDASRAVGDPNPAFGAQFAGFVLGETLSDLSGSLLLTTPATVASPAGTFAITPAGVTSTNYAISFVDGELTVGSVFTEGGAVTDLTEGGVIAQRRGGFRASPVTPGDAAFRTSERDIGLAAADPFALSYSLGEVIAFRPASQDGSEGFVPAAGGLEPEATGDCGVSANLGGAGRDGCVSVVVTESFWDQQ
ncbi:filamentous hemagglutinin N-terminal domain-containing protein [Roseobacter sp. YSTF-M11]|uniref:Filamentous hemagglutinin N-terminal domain-containing protein n=1 Tax=Roseobacter insulae TaxID=2859783 RepID=A0A9X1K1G7_9RHOB|nr:MBG domain-containing protein [Roseobacter insulae]MBW4707473.1 filamentous hemagglutinin N-terminal domain-containing protein [Roseobacter insulae]